MSDRSHWAHYKIGDQLGHAEFGRVVTDLDGDLICGECGRPCKQLATHLRYSHNMSAEQYREKYGLGRTTKLVSESVRQKNSEAANRRIDEIVRKFDATRRPDLATEASRGKPWTPETRAKRQAQAKARRTPDLTPSQVEMLGTGLDLQAWADAARKLLADGVSIAAIARAADIMPSTVRQRINRYPAQ